jgi:cytosine/adenosine deaminase-related metal-dependent hydrolase
MSVDRTPQGDVQVTGTETLCLRGARVLALDDADTEWDEADVVVEGARIVAIGPGAAQAFSRPFARTIDARGLLAMPGLVNGHFHSPGNLMKGGLPGYPLELFMLHEVPPLAEGGDAVRLAYVRTAIGALEMLRRGVTAVHDDAYHVPIATPEGIDAIFAAYRDAGLRATVTIDQPELVEHEKLPWIGEMLPPDLKRAMDEAPRQSGDELIALYRGMIARWHGGEGGRLRVAVSCSAPQRVSVPYLQALSELSRENDLPFDVHLLETRLQRAHALLAWGMSPIRRLHELGVLDERMLAIHAIWIDEADLAMLADAGCTVAHNPDSNLRLGSGVMPWRALHDAGVPVCLGSDEMNADDSVNPWFVGKTAALVHTLASPDFDRWPRPAEVLRAMTRGGARGMRAEGEFGTLCVGARADLLLLDLDTVAFTPLNDLRRQLVHCEDGQSLRMTIVDGRVVYDAGRITTVDEAALRAEMRELMFGFRARTAAAAAQAERLEPYYRAMHARASTLDVGLRRTLY